MPIFIHGFLLVSILGLSFEATDPLGNLMGSLTRYPGVVFFGLSIFLLIMSRLVPGVLFRGKMKEGTKDQAQILSLYWVSYLIGLIMLEGIGLLGLLLTVLENDMRIYTIFSMVALLNLLIRFPREKDIMNLIGADQQATQPSQS